jgi:tripeptidyl-peptidase-1
LFLDLNILNFLVISSLPSFCSFQALAPNADTFFYSFSDLNPYDPINEGFLTYLLTVANQTNPPLVHSLSYGDQESSIFNATNEGSSQYGERCDQEFMMMGLRGLTVLFSSGDDGIGGDIFSLLKRFSPLLIINNTTILTNCR